MSRCDGCTSWVLRRMRVYSDGSGHVDYHAPDGKGHCEVLKVETAADFGCNQFNARDWDHIERQTIEGAPWQHFKMGSCPDCQGRGCGEGDQAGACNRCAGTGKVRFYDDGYVGDEQTRRHPKEPETPPIAQQKVVILNNPRNLSTGSSGVT